MNRLGPSQSKARSQIVQKTVKVYLLEEVTLFCCNKQPQILESEQRFISLLYIYFSHTVHFRSGQLSGMRLTKWQVALQDAPTLWLCLPSRTPIWSMCMEEGEGLENHGSPWMSQTAFHSQCTATTSHMTLDCEGLSSVTSQETGSRGRPDVQQQKSPSKRPEPQGPTLPTLRFGRRLARSPGPARVTCQRHKCPAF